jgi:hypothetical protein
MCGCALRQVGDFGQVKAVCEEFCWTSRGTESDCKDPGWCRYYYGNDADCLYFYIYHYYYAPSHHEPQSCRVPCVVSCRLVSCR